MHRRTGWGAALVLAVFAGAPALADGFVVSDRAFFDAIPHTLIDFETRHDGTPIVVPEGENIPMNFGEYSTLGVAIFGDPNWANFTSDDLETIQAGHATPHNSLAMFPVSPGDPVGFAFLKSFPVRSFGIFVMMDVSVPTARPTFHISRDETVIETIVFEGDLVQGRIGDIEFGFVGYTDDEPFAAVLLENFTRPVFDDLHFSAVPAPGAGAAFGLLGLGALTRRRRR